MTVDDLRLWKKYEDKKKIPKVSEKTDIYTYNTTIHDVGVVLGSASIDSAGSGVDGRLERGKR